MEGERVPLPARPSIGGGRYALERIIGQGGMGDVWEARHTALDVKVAIKFLHGAFAASEQGRKRFLIEAQVAARLKTRHAVQVFDFGITEAGEPYLVMDLLDGESLAMRLRRDGRLPPADTVNFLGQAARALQRAHGLGIVHRDFKPENIFLTRDEEGAMQVKVVDFGIAKLLGELESDLPPESASELRRPRGQSTIGRTNGAIGTPRYMSPEQIKNEAGLGAAADVWAFGVVAYECLTGLSPFDAHDAPGVFAKVLNGSFSRATRLNPSLPAAFDDWFQRACANDPSARFEAADVAAGALADALMLARLTPATALPVPIEPVADQATMPDQAAQTLAFGRTQPQPPPPTPTPTEATPLATDAGFARPVKRSRTFIYVGAAAMIVLSTASVVAMRHATVSSAPRLESVVSSEESPPPTSLAVSSAPSVATAREAPSTTLAIAPTPASALAPNANTNTNSNTSKPRPIGQVAHVVPIAQGTAVVAAGSPVAPVAPVVTTTVASSAPPTPATTASAKKPASPWELPELGI